MTATSHRAQQNGNQPRALRTLWRRVWIDHDGVVNAPAFRIWPPVALGGPLATGILLTVAVGDPVSIAGSAARWIGAALAFAFALWNGWTLSVMAMNRTAILPGAPTTLVLKSGPFRVSRNPLYVGLITLDVALSLLVPSFWALTFVPFGILALWWGAVRPEETYLSGKFGAEYEEYRARVRRWL